MNVAITCIPWIKCLLHNKIFSVTVRRHHIRSSRHRALQVRHDRHLDVFKVLRVTHSKLQPSPAELAACLRENSRRMTAKHTVRSKYGRLLARTLLQSVLSHRAVSPRESPQIWPFLRQGPAETAVLTGVVSGLQGGRRNRPVDPAPAVNEIQENLRREVRRIWPHPHCTLMEISKMMRRYPPPSTHFCLYGVVFCLMSREFTFLKVVICQSVMNRNDNNDPNNYTVSQEKGCHPNHG